MTMCFLVRKVKISKWFGGEDVLISVGRARSRATVCNDVYRIQKQGNRGRLCSTVTGVLGGNSAWMMVVLEEHNGQWDKVSERGLSSR